MSPRDGEELSRALLAAKERDLMPLLEESAEFLDLDFEQTEAMDDFLSLAWFSGTRCSRNQIEARATEENPDLEGNIISTLETEFKALMEQSAEALNLTIANTITMWNYLHDAWMAGNHSCETELLALYIEAQSDVSAEALKWLEERGV